MSWQIALVFNLFFATCRGFFDKAVANRMSPLVGYFYVCLSVLGISTVLFLIQNGRFPEIFPVIIFVGLLYGIGFGCYYLAIRINLSQSVVFGSYSILLSMFLGAVFFAEWQYFIPTTFVGQRTLAGIVIALIALFIILRSGTKKEQKLESKWIVLISITVLMSGIGTFLSKVFLTDHSVLETLISQMIGNVIMLFAINGIRRNSFYIKLKNAGWVAVDGLMMTGGILFYFIAIRQGPLVVILPIQTLGVSITVSLIGLFIYKEFQHFSRDKIVGIIIALVGILLLTTQ